MAESGASSPASDQGWRRALRWWGRAGAFLAGLFVGAVVVGLLSGGTVVVAAPTPADTDVVPSGAPPEGGATGQVSLDADCLRAVNAAQDVARLLDELGEAIVVFNAARLDEVVRQLQPLQRRLQAGVDACEVEAATTGGSPSPAPTILPPEAAVPPPEAPPAPASPPAAD